MTHAQYFTVSDLSVTSQCEVILKT